MGLPSQLILFYNLIASCSFNELGKRVDQTTPSWEIGRSSKKGHIFSYTCFETVYERLLGQKEKEDYEIALIETGNVAFYEIKVIA